MSLIHKHLDKNNLHHAYLIEGNRKEIVPEVVEFLKSLGINTVGNSDFIQINLDSFKIEDARNLKSYASQKGFSSAKKIFIISANSILLEAQNSLLKMFEEPTENTHFFLIVPDTSALLRTFISRFYLISKNSDSKNNEEMKQAEKFLTMPVRSRIDFIKELLTEIDEVPTTVGIPTEVGKDLALESTRSKALKFLNALEASLHSNLVKNFSGLLQPSAGTFPVQNSLPDCFQHIFKVREFLRMPGSSTKSLMESVALVVPDFKN